MSDDRKDTNPKDIFDSSIKRMTAFGYVDRPWVMSAFASFFDEYLAKKKKGEQVKSKGFWAKFAEGFAKMFGGGASVDDYRFAHMNKDPVGRKAKELMRAVLAKVPSIEEKNAPRGGRGRSVVSLDVAPEDEAAKLVAKFLQISGIEETGFPVRLIGEQGEGAPTKEQTKEAAKRAERNSALSTLTGGLLYRFAYDHDKKLNWEDTRKVFRASGLYRIYVVPADPTYVERRLMMVRLDDNGAIVRAAEIRKPRDRFIVRGGYVIPASGINTFILSSDFSPEVLADMIERDISPAARHAVFPDGTPKVSQTSASFLQEHQLGFYSLFSRGEGELRGAVLEAPTPSTVVGYRIDPQEVKLGEIAQSQISEDAMVAREDETPRTPDLGFLAFDEIRDRRDQILIAAISRNPSVSIDIG